VNVGHKDCRRPCRVTARGRVRSRLFGRHQFGHWVDTIAARTSVRRGDGPTPVYSGSRTLPAPLGACAGSGPPSWPWLIRRCLAVPRSGFSHTWPLTGIRWEPFSYVGCQPGHSPFSGHSAGAGVQALTGPLSRALWVLALWTGTGPTRKPTPPSGGPSTAFPSARVSGLDTIHPSRVHASATRAQHRRHGHVSAMGVDFVRRD
jgi:hypothetical protein